MTAKHERCDILDRNPEFVGEELTEARGIEDAGHADHHLLR
jgi:hypothetical protein